MQITVVGGTGYVGLTTAACLAAKGHVVYCVGRDTKKIEQLQKGEPPIFEEGLGELLKEALGSKHFIPTTDLKEAIPLSDIVFICVGTPTGEDGSQDLSQIEVTSEQIGAALLESHGYCVVVVKSTVVPGTTERQVLPLLERFSRKKVGEDFGLCMNPEFLREGQAIKDFLYPKEQGIVIGEFDKRSGDVLFQIYSQFEAEILRTNIRAAEMIKYARNSYLAKDISFANEMANICQTLGVDYLEVKRGMEMDLRIGKGRFLRAGAGFGGACFPKDVKAIISKAHSSGVPAKLLEATIEVNNDQPFKMIDLLHRTLGSLKGKKVTVLGLAFKNGTDDLREAPAVKIVKTLCNQGVEVIAHDPKALEKAVRVFKDDPVRLAESSVEALKDADACLIVTDWPEYSNPELFSAMRGRVVIDGRRIISPQSLPAGFRYFAIGFPFGE
jgi:UDPglucose 6-dehydrogenase